MCCTAVYSHITSHLISLYILVLSEYIIQNPHIFNEKRILSLGSGCGLTEIVIHQVCKYKSIVATDYTNDIVSNMYINFMRNHMNVIHRKRSDDTSHHDVKNKLMNNNTSDTSHNHHDGDNHGSEPYVEVMKLDWFDVTADMINDIDADVIISADTIYLPETHDALANCFKLALLHGKSAHTPVQCFMCQPVRNVETYNHYIQSFHNAGLMLTEISLTTDHVPHRFKFDRLDMHLHYVTLAH